MAEQQCTLKEEQHQVAESLVENGTLREALRMMGEQVRGTVEKVARENWGVGDGETTRNV